MYKNYISIGVILLFLLSIGSPVIFGNSNIISNGNFKYLSVENNGLMNSSWPMFGQNIRHTGLSEYGKSGNWYLEKWSKGIGPMTLSSPSIDINETIYIGSNDWYLYAVNPDGTLKWKYKTGGGVPSTPAIAEDGTIYVGSEDDYLYAINSDGTLKWSLFLGIGWVKSSPVIDDEGMVYAGSAGGNNIWAIYPNGTKKWSYKTGSDVYSSPALDGEGTVYCGSHDGYMYALYTSNGTLKWKYGTGDYCGGAGATVGDDGTIYFGDVKGYLHAVNPNGTRKWRKDLLRNIYTSPAITEEGNIIVGTYRGYVYSFNPDNGSENWKYEIEKYTWIPSSPSIDKFGIIYIGAENGWFYALNPDGTLRWKFDATTDAIFSSPAINGNGTIYFGTFSSTFNAKLYALEPIDDNAPDIPIINGPVSGTYQTLYNYTAESSDIDDDNISYYFNWGDGTVSGWTDYVASGTSVELSHSWQNVGTYTVKVKAKDDYGMQSDWGELVVNMPRNKATSNVLFFRFLERFPLLNLLLQRLRI